MNQHQDRLAAGLRDRYRIDAPLGQGGMATVYRAQDLRHERPVALKVLRPELAGALGPDRFLREIRVTARLDHPGILPIFDSGETGGLLWYAMPLVVGESLRSWLREGRKLPVAEAIRITREVAEALAYAHDTGVVHRDIKPENILLRGSASQERNSTAGWHPVIADFGIAHLEATAGDRLTSTGFTLGTPAYMSPEQATGNRDVDARTDVYALGCVLYEMLCGEPPFTGANAQAILARQLTEAPRPPHMTGRRFRPGSNERSSRRSSASPRTAFSRQSCSPKPWRSTPRRTHRSAPAGPAVGCSRRPSPSLRWAASSSGLVAALPRCLFRRWNTTSSPFSRSCRAVAILRSPALGATSSSR